eukprot:SAG31_NODE_2940_length_4882_cov_7.133807_2_plen_74_part_00
MRRHGAKNVSGSARGRPRDFGCRLGSWTLHDGERKSTDLNQMVGLDGAHWVARMHALLYLDIKFASVAALDLR